MGFEIPGLYLEIMFANTLKTLIQREVVQILEALNQDTEKLYEEYLDEGGFSRLVRSLAGMEPKIDSIGIITAENPMAQQLPAAKNKMRNKQLAQEIRGLGYGFYQIQGKYGNIERPYVVPNISKKDIVKLGVRHEQDSVIFVQKTTEGSLAELIETHGNHTSVKSKAILPLANDVEDFFSIYKGRKFVIPFFDDVFKDKALVKGRIV